MKTKNQSIARQCHEELGEWLAQIIQNEEIQTLHDLTKALVKFKRHKQKRQPDYDLEVLFSMSGLFPPGWTKNWRASKIKPGTRDKIAMRDIKENLARIDSNFSEETWPSRCRRIQRYAKEFNIPLDDTPGRPRQKRDTIQSKNSNCAAILKSRNAVSSRHGKDIKRKTETGERPNTARSSNDSKRRFQRTRGRRLSSRQTPHAPRLARPARPAMLQADGKSDAIPPRRSRRMA